MCLHSICLKSLFAVCSLVIQLYLVDIRLRTLQGEKIDTFTENDVPFLSYVLILRFTPSLLVPFDIYKDLDLEYPMPS